MQCLKWGRYLQLQSPNAVVIYNGPEDLSLVESGNGGIFSSWVFANTFAKRSADSDTAFRGCIPAGLAERYSAYDL